MIFVPYGGDYPVRLNRHGIKLSKGLWLQFYLRNREPGVRIVEYNLGDYKFFSVYDAESVRFHSEDPEIGPRNAEFLDTHGIHAVVDGDLLRLPAGIRSKLRESGNFCIIGATTHFQIRPIEGEPHLEFYDALRYLNL